jgi:tetratricopeptide (TPR) repeat protein
MGYKAPIKEEAFMKALVLSAALAAAAASAIIPFSSAAAAVMTVGGPLSTICYQSARSGDGRSSAVDGCTRALQEEALTAWDRAATHVNRGIVFMSAGRFSEADSDFDAALRLNAALPDGWLNKGFLRLRLGKGRDALPLIQRGIDAGAERQALAIFARGVAREQMGEFRAAYADLRLAQQLEPGWKLPRQYLASYQVRR